jgi:hypothetical protein
MISMLLPGYRLHPYCLLIHPGVLSNIDNAAVYRKVKISKFHSQRCVFVSFTWRLFTQKSCIKTRHHIIRFVVRLYFRYWNCYMAQYWLFAVTDAVKSSINMNSVSLYPCVCVVFVNKKSWVTGKDTYSLSVSEKKNACCGLHDNVFRAHHVVMGITNSMQGRTSPCICYLTICSTNGRHKRGYIPAGRLGRSV